MSEAIRIAVLTTDYEAAIKNSYFIIIINKNECIQNSSESALEALLSAIFN